MQRSEFIRVFMNYSNEKISRLIYIVDLQNTYGIDKEYLNMNTYINYYSLKTIYKSGMYLNAIYTYKILVFALCELYSSIQ